MCIASSLVPAAAAAAASVAAFAPASPASTWSLTASALGNATAGNVEVAIRLNVALILFGVGRATTLI